MNPKFPDFDRYLVVRSGEYIGISPYTFDSLLSFTIY